MRRAAAAVAAGLIAATGAAGASAAARPPVPVLAYYYIWFNATSWQRAKIDTPLLGRYSSDEVRTMRQHIRWAQQAGIDGFVVSWKSTPTLNRRLARLIAVARQSRFKLAIMYEGLDFERRPLPVARVARDLQFFQRHFASSPVFHIYSKPLVIWSGTWKFTPAAIARVTSPLRSSLLLLASQRQADDYARVASSVDGDAYYWAAVDPFTTPGYEAKLKRLAGVVHAHGGMWIAPAAPGFDARSLGGTSLIARRSGKTLEAEYAAALDSSPDAIGLISWNEFSENTQIEPSTRYGSQSLDVLAGLRRAPGPRLVGFDSDNGASSGIGNVIAFATGGTILGLLGLVLVARRRITQNTA
ncbi:MAG TPA: endo-1,3-alpha-glucanase family glycosylhydrolase [Gaiellaceae bacterium]|nr:endo-1,3-alpha-glucanase family glycosylhydrolase [Gaiellaceae bacterium]